MIRDLSSPGASPGFIKNLWKKGKGKWLYLDHIIYIISITYSLVLYAFSENTPGYPRDKAEAMTMRGHPLLFVGLIEMKHLFHVTLRFPVWGDRVELQNRSFSSVIGSKGELDIVLEELQKVSKVSDSSIDILARIEGVYDRQILCRFWHQLHQTHGTGAGDSPGIKIGFSPDNRLDESRIDTMRSRSPLNQVVKVIVIRIPEIDVTILFDIEGVLGIRRNVRKMNHPILINVLIDPSPGHGR